MTMPMIGVHQAGEPFWATPPRVHSGALVHWRHVDGTLTPLTGQAVVRTPPTTPALLRTSGSIATRVHPPGLVGWEPRPWDNGIGGLRDELGARLTDDELWAIGSAAGGPLRIAVGEMSLLHEWTEIETFAADDVLWALANDPDLSEASGAMLTVVRASTSSLELRFDNGVDTPVASTVSDIAIGDRCSLRGVLEADGDGDLFVRAYLVRNGGAEVAGTASAAITAPPVWGETDDALVHVYAPQWLRTSHLRPGVCSRALLTSSL